MRFCDKLPKKRKENNLSQEQLADRLGVSRQAVSKWESGQSYPDMDKLLQICKILDCKLDDIMDDGSIESSKNNNKLNINNYLKDFLDFITRTYNMICSMTFKERIKCFIEMIFLFLLLLFSGKIILYVLNSLLFDHFLSIPKIGSFFFIFFQTLLTILLIIFGIIIFIHLFKVRYLDYFITIEDNNVMIKTEETKVEDSKEQKYVNEKDKEKVIIRDPKHSTLSFFNALARIILIIVKVFTFFAMTFIAMIFFFVVSFGIISISNVTISIIFLYLFIMSLGAASFCLIIIYFLYNFIFNKLIKFRLAFYLLAASIVICATGFALSFNTYLNYSRVDYKNSNNLITSTEYIDMNDNLSINCYYTNNINYVIDNSMNNIKIDITHSKDIKYYLYENKYDGHDNYHIELKDDFYDMYNTFINDLKSKNIRSYEDGNIIGVTVTLSQENYDKLIKNNNN